MQWSYCSLAVFLLIFSCLSVVFRNRYWRDLDTHHHILIGWNSECVGFIKQLTNGNPDCVNGIDTLVFITQLNFHFTYHRKTKWSLACNMVTKWNMRQCGKMHMVGVSPHRYHVLLSGYIIVPNNTILPAARHRSFLHLQCPMPINDGRVMGWILMVCWRTMINQQRLMTSSYRGKRKVKHSQANRHCCEICSCLTRINFLGKTTPKSSMSILSCLCSRDSSVLWAISVIYILLMSTTPTRTSRMGGECNTRRISLNTTYWLEALITV